MKDGWEIKSLEQVCDKIFAGGDKPKDSFSPVSSEEHPTPIFANGEKNKGLYGYTSTAKVAEPSITLSARGTIGYSEIRKEPFFPIVRLIVLTPNKEIIDLKYLQYVISSMDFKNSGTSIPQLTVTMIKKYKSEFPPLLEQKSIVKILDEAFAKIDQAITHIEKNIENAKELFQSKLNEIFSQRGEGWEEKSFKKVCILQRGYDLPKRLREKGEYSIVTSSGIKDTHNEFKVQGPGVVTGRSGSIGKVFYIGGNFWPLNTALYIKEINSNIERYVYYFLIAFDLSRFSSGAGVPTLNRNFVHDEIVLSTSDHKIQNEIITILDNVANQIEIAINTYTIKSNSLEDLKKSILQKAFSGELTKTV